MRHLVTTLCSRKRAADRTVHSLGRRALAYTLGIGCVFVLASSSVAESANTVTYTATETIPVPPASSYAGSGGGDGWGLAFSQTAVYNVFHHSDVLTVACHLQADASPCWDPITVTDGTGDNFSTSGQPGLWLDQKSGRLYVFATRVSDSTGGVVCIDPSQAPANSVFCGFTPLSAIGESPINGISGLSDPALVGTRWYSFNYVSGAAIGGGTYGTENRLLCFDVSTLSACPSQPFGVGIPSGGSVSDGSYPGPEVAAIAGRVIVPVTVDGVDQLACVNGTTGASCNGSWPYSLDFSYDGNYGAPFPLMTSAGVVTGFCLPTGSDPCFDLSGIASTTPAGLLSTVGATTGWDGPAVSLGPRVYLPNGTTDQVDCFDYSTGASCSDFPRSFPGLTYMYTVNADPQRPTCLWVNSDSGSGQIQNFDAYTAGGCGEGPIRVLASSFVVPTQLCIPASYTSLQVLAPPRSSYTSGSVSFEDDDANPISGIADMPLDGSGSVSLTGLNLSTNNGLPQFLITLDGASGTPTAVTVQLTWTGVQDPSCVPSGGGTSGNTDRYVALGDSVPYGHGLSNPYPQPVIGLPSTDVGQGPSPDAYPGLVARFYGLHMAMRLANCPDASRVLVGDDLAFSGAAAARGNATPGNDQCPSQFSGTVTIQNDELPAANLPAKPAKLVTIQAGADDINFSACLLWELSKLGPRHWAGTQCVVNGGVTDVVRNKLNNLEGALTDIIEKTAPYTNTVAVLDYYQIIPKPANFARSSLNPKPSYTNPVCFGLSQNLQGAYNDAVVLQSELNLAIIRAVNDARADGITNVKLVDISGLESGHEMCTGSPALFSSEPMPVRNFQVDLERSAFSPAARAELQAYSWRAAHPNQFGQKDIAKAVESVVGP